MRVKFASILGIGIKTTQFLCFVLLGLTTIPVSGYSQLLNPENDIQNLDSPRPEQPVRVKTAQVVLADYELLRKDFPILKRKTNAQVDKWILENAAYISEAQATQSTVNTKVSVAVDKNGNFVRTKGVRPEYYNRALVFEVDADGSNRKGILDGKGFGSLWPKPGSHSNGLASTGEMVREFLYEQLVRKILGQDRTVGCYAVIDWGFDMKYPDGSKVPSGAVLRQGHQRVPVVWSDVGNRRNNFLAPEDSRKIEMELRRYGITSGGDKFGKLPVDAVNIQGTPSKALFDFGSFLSVERFTKPVMKYYDAIKLQYGESKIEAAGTPLSKPGEASFVQPEPASRIPLEVWGSSRTNTVDPKYDNPWVYAHETALAFSEGRATRKAFQKLMRDMMGINQIANLSNCSDSNFRVKLQMGDF